MLNNSINRYGNPNGTRGYFGGKLHNHPRLVKQRQLKPIKTKTESGNYFCIRIVLSIKLRLIFMSTNLEYREIERQSRKRKCRGQASEAQGEKERQRARARDKKQRRHFLVKEQYENFVAAGGK